MSTITLGAGAPKRIGFISTRFHGTDGVTLEAEKWAQILTQQGHSCFWMAGLLDTPPETSYCAPLAFFRHPEVLAVQDKLFGATTRPRETTNQIQFLKERLKDEIYHFIEQFRIEVLIPQNILAIPMHVPLGLAMTEVIAESGLPATVVPNIHDFETAPPRLDDYNADLRHEIGLREDDLFILQPTRVVARKGIEHAIELVRQLKEPRAKLVISHPAGDEGDDYIKLLKERIADAQIDVRFIADRVGEERAVNADGKKVYTLFDVYPHADLVTYPSYYEGFGNAFLEAIYFGKPVVVHTYAVYARDIAPLGFKTIEMTQLVSHQVVEQTREILQNKALREEWAKINYELGLKYFSYAVGRRKLAARMANLFGEGV